MKIEKRIPTHTIFSKKKDSSISIAILRQRIKDATEKAVASKTPRGHFKKRFPNL